ncbi:lyase family protein [Kineosporia sp. NBRC 101731]|uniref:lyase family protein n=1 Tax=Kineosporia sp. NBRC 101731 TaxID=3032199 RepID=UPI0025569B5C|nr:lyase family protein [Kineosporia sp. NBRC 101731]
MTIFWPGDERAGALMSPAALLTAMIRVEQVWLDGLVTAGIAPARAAGRLTIGMADADGLASAVAAGTEAGGNPVIPLTRWLRSMLEGDAALWVHRGLTSQDVMDTALALCLRDVLERVREELDTQILALAALAGEHRNTAMAGRTLTQHAVPTSFGLKVAQWLTALLDARDALDRLPALKVQLGGAAGTLSAVLELARGSGSADPGRTVRGLLEGTADGLGLAWAPPWHTARGPVTAAGDVLVGACDAWGRIARDVIVLGRPEIGELAEPSVAGRGGSSTMAQKQNPVLSVLIRRTALSAPQWGATLHLAAAEAVDERPDGSWHTEWPALRSLSRATVSAAGQASELLTGLRVDPHRMLVNLEAAGPAILAEQASMRELSGSTPGSDPRDYLGLTGLLVDDVLQRALTSAASTLPSAATAGSTLTSGGNRGS